MTNVIGTVWNDVFCCVLSWQVQLRGILTLVEGLSTVFRRLQLVGRFQKANGARLEGCAGMCVVGGRHSCVVRTSSHRCWNF